MGCLQELKSTDSDFPKQQLRKRAMARSGAGKILDGVAILARGCEPVVTPTNAGDATDIQSPLYRGCVNGVAYRSLYGANGNPQPGPKFAYKLAWMKRLIAHAANLYAAGVPVVLAGDYNIVPPTMIFIRQFLCQNALVQPQSRAAFQRLLRQGWVTRSARSIR